MLSTTDQPKRFLKKGEGLKRFAAYKPPLPATAKKVERRQTFVRFKFDAKNSSTNNHNHNNNNNNNNTNNNNHKHNHQHHTHNLREASTDFLPPELFNDDSINLSTEVPKIAPPKIIHTPIRPNRHALGTLTYRQSDLTTPTPGSGIAALDKQIKQIESNVNELREKLKKCECIAMTQAQVQATAPNTTTTNTVTTRRRPTTRAAARAAAKTTKESDNSNNNNKNNSTPPQLVERPSADADNNNSRIPIEKIILDLAENVAQLRLKFDEEIKKRDD